MSTARIALVAAAALSVALVAPASAASPRDKVVGAQKVTNANGDFQHVRVSAHSGPAGENPIGQVHATAQSPFIGGTFAVKGKVVCLDVTATQARVAALLDEPGPGGATHVTLIINDNGNPVQGQSPDFAFIGFTSSPPANCASSGTMLVGDASGNLLVNDAT